jgi:autotransporter-associated beta strand protein
VTTTGSGGNVVARAGGTVVYDNTMTAVTNRTYNKGLVLDNGTFIYRLGATGVSEQFAQFQSRWGANVFRIENDSAVNSTISFSGAAPLFNGGSTLNIEGLIGTANQRVTFANAPALTAGILPRVYVNGSDFATIGGNGLAAYSAYFAGTPDQAVAANTVRISADTAVSSPALQWNGLLLNGAVTLDSGSAASGTALTLSLPGILARGGVSTIGAGLRVGFTTEALVSVAPGATLNVDGQLVAYNMNFTKGLDGDLNFRSRQRFNPLGNTVTLNGGVTRLAAGDNTLFPGVNMAISYGATLDLQGTSQMLGVLRSPQANTDAWSGAGDIISQTPALLMAVGNASYGGRIGGATGSPISFARGGAGNGAATLSLWSEQTYTGPTLVMSGYLQLFERARLSNTSAIDLNYGQLRIYKNAGTSRFRIDDMVPDTTPITLRGGTLSFWGRHQMDDFEEVGDVTLESGLNWVDVTRAGTGLNSARLTMNRLRREDGSAAVVMMTAYGTGTGANLGTFGTDSGRVVSRIAPALQRGILGGWAVSEDDFLSYVGGSTPELSSGFGALNQVGFAQYDVNFDPFSVETTTFGTNVKTFSSTADQNVRLLAPLVMPSGNQAANSLNMRGFGGITFATNTDRLTLTTGGLIGPRIDASIGAAVDQGRLTAGSTGDLYIWNRQNTLTINSRIVDSPEIGAVRSVFVPAGSTYNNALGGIVVTNGGSGYTSTPTVTLTNAPAAASARAVVENGVVTGIVILNPGANGTGGDVTVTISGGGGTGATAAWVNSLGSALVTGGGSGYTSAPTVTVVGGGGFGATAVANIQGGVVTGVTITNPGSGYTSVPTLVFTDGGGTGAAATAGFGGVIALTAPNTYSRGTIVQGGTGWANTPSAGQAFVTGTLLLASADSTVVVPAGGLTLNGATVSMINSAGQIHPSNVVTLNGPSSLNLFGDNQLAGLTINNIGGNRPALVNTDGVLSLSGPVTVTSNNPYTVPSLNGTLDFLGQPANFQISPIRWDGRTVVDFVPTLNVNAQIQNATQLNFTGGGTLLMSGNNLFSAPIRVGSGILAGAGIGSQPTPFGVDNSIILAGGSLSVRYDNGGLSNVSFLYRNTVEIEAGQTEGLVDVNNSGNLAMNNLVRFSGLKLSPTQTLRVTGGNGYVLGFQDIQQTAPGNLRFDVQSGLGLVVPGGFTEGTRPSNVGQGTLIFSGNNTFSSDVTVTGASLNGASMYTGQTNEVFGTGKVTLADGANFLLLPQFRSASSSGYTAGGLNGKFYPFFSAPSIVALTTGPYTGLGPTGTMSSVLLGDLATNIRPNSSAGGFAQSVAVYDGILRITTPGYYSFVTQQDDASILSIDGAPLVVGPTFSANDSAPLSLYLSAGDHFIQGRLQNAAGGTGMNVMYSGPDTVAAGLGKGFVPINPAQLFTPSSSPSSANGFLGAGRLANDLSVAANASVTLDARGADLNATVRSLTLAGGSTTTVLNSGGYGWIGVETPLKVAGAGAVVRPSTAAFLAPMGVNDDNGVGGGYGLVKDGNGVFSLGDSAGAFRGVLDIRAGTVSLMGGGDFGQWCGRYLGGEHDGVGCRGPCVWEWDSGERHDHGHRHGVGSGDFECSGDALWGEWVAGDAVRFAGFERAVVNFRDACGVDGMGNGDSAIRVVQLERVNSDVGVAIDPLRASRV